MSRILPTLALSFALVPAATAMAAGPSVSITPERVAHGESFTAKGHGWASKKAVDRVMYFTLRGPDGDKFHAGNATLSKRGNWTFTYKIKRFIEKGKWRLIVRQDRKADGEVVRFRRSATFTVTR